MILSVWLVLAGMFCFIAATAFEERGKYSFIAFGIALIVFAVVKIYMSIDAGSTSGPYQPKTYRHVGGVTIEELRKNRK